MYLLDTNVVTELRRAASGRSAPRVLVWANSIPAHELYLSVVSILELEIGILSMQRKDAKQGAMLRSWMNDQVAPAFSNRILSIDESVARSCARLHVPDPRSGRDALIAATALIHRLTVVTRNTADFDATGVKLINPWSSSRVPEKT